jgi:putative flavoprotein involved in K+ transport
MEELPSLRDGYAPEEILSIDLKATGISTVIWARGYTFDFSLVKLPVCDEFGFPITARGVTQYPGLYFVGLPWLPGQKTGFLLGVADQAAYVAAQIAGRTY